MTGLNLDGTEAGFLYRVHDHRIQSAATRIIETVVAAGKQPAERHSPIWADKGRIQAKSVRTHYTPA